MSAVLDKNTRLPGHIHLTGSLEAEYECVNLHQGQGLELIGTNLSKAFLLGVNLSQANLSQANLAETNLSDAKLIEADLREANLENANLVHADFKKANLTKTNLRGANLRGAFNLTCEQIMSAVLDKNTRLPGYIHLTGSLEAEYECENQSKKIN